MNAESRQRPAGLWIVAVGGFILGLLGCCFAVWSVAGIAMMGAGGMGMSGGLGDPALSESLQEQQQLMMPINIALAIGQLFISIALLVGASLLFTWKSFAPKVMGTTCIIAGVLELISLAAGVWGSLRVGEAMKSMGGNMEGAAEAAQMGMAFGLCFAVVWGGAKLVYFIGSAIYMRNTELRALFGAAESLEPYDAFEG